MSRAQDLLAAAVANARAAADTLADGDCSKRVGLAADAMENMRDRFFFKSLAGVPLANRARKAANALKSGGGESAVAELENVVAEMTKKLDEPGAVLT